jgi:hypothetical protein
MDKRSWFYIDDLLAMQFVDSYVSYYMTPGGSQPRILAEPVLPKADVVSEMRLELIRLNDYLTSQDYPKLNAKMVAGSKSDHAYLIPQGSNFHRTSSGAAWTIYYFTNVIIDACIVNPRGMRLEFGYEFLRSQTSYISPGFDNNYLMNRTVHPPFDRVRHLRVQGRASR